MGKIFLTIILPKKKKNTTKAMTFDCTFVSTLCIGREHNIKLSHNKGSLGEVC